jgi:hypothetical protein
VSHHVLHTGVHFVCFPRDRCSLYYTQVYTLLALLQILTPERRRSSSTAMMCVLRCANTAASQLVFPPSLSILLSLPPSFLSLGQRDTSASGLLKFTPSLPSSRSLSRSLSLSLSLSLSRALSISLARALSLSRALSQLSTNLCECRQQDKSVDYYTIEHRRRTPTERARYRERERDREKEGRGADYLLASSYTLSLSLSLPPPPSVSVSVSLSLCVCLSVSLSHTHTQRAQLCKTTPSGRS